MNSRLRLPVRIVAALVLITLLAFSTGMSIPFISFTLRIYGAPLLDLYWHGLTSSPHPLLSFINPEKEVITLVAVGDVMLSRHVGEIISSKGPFYPFSQTAYLTRWADIAFCNLENAFSTQGTPIPGKMIWFRANPDTAIGLTFAGFDVVSLANNHSLDYDTDAFLDTLTTLENEGIKYVGGGRDIDEARKPVIIERKGIKVGFLAYSELAHIFWDWGYPRAFVAKSGIPGVAPMEIDIMEEDIKKLRESVDIVVVSLHWGEEYEEQPSEKERELAHRLIDCGAQIILGHHPHVLRGLEVYKDGVIAYSMGNFVFDQRNQKTKKSMLLQFELTSEGLHRVIVYPILIENSRPSIPDVHVGEEILSKLYILSEELSTKLQIYGKRGVIYPSAQQQEP